MALIDETRKKFSLSKVFGKKETDADRNSIESNISSAYFGGSPLHSPFSSPRIFKTLTDSNIFSDFSSLKQGCVRTEAFRIFVATWNVGGNPPHPGLDLSDFLPSDDHSDIYVLGFQEIVPLNAGSVLVEDNEPAMRWLAIINKALNRPSNNCDSSISPYYCHSPFSKSNKPHSSLTTLLSVDSGAYTLNSNISKSSLKEAKRSFNLSHGIRLKSCNCPIGIAHRTNGKSCFPCKKPNMRVSDLSEEEAGDEGSTSFTTDDLDFSNTSSHEKYCLVASKQMVGIFVSIWVRKELVPHVSHVRLSSVGRGIMNYLGNKGCISVSMLLHQTSICFVCSHLASGEKEGDELKRNLDVIEILKHTQFKRICKRSGRRIPRKILDHERVIWLGDLNYRISLSYYDAKQLVQENNWGALFENDQLKKEREAGRVFKGWNEGKIYFAPTYKYSNNSDEYLGDTVTSKKKRRTPAWCDRILWHGDGVVQLSYFRGESRFSDHRPVCAAFIVEVAVLDSKMRKVFSTSNMKVGAEDLLS